MAGDTVEEKKGVKLPYFTPHVPSHPASLSSSKHTASAQMSSAQGTRSNLMGRQHTAKTWTHSYIKDEVNFCKQQTRSRNINIVSMEETSADTKPKQVVSGGVSNIRLPRLVGWSPWAASA